MQQLAEYQIIEKILEYFEDNYEMMRYEGGHMVSMQVKEMALAQVLSYYEKMKTVANTVTHTEVKLTLPEQHTHKGRNFTIEGVVDIVRDDEETAMYDIKTHEREYIVANLPIYESQLNVYAHIWQELRQEKLDSTAIISTALPKNLQQARLLNDPYRISLEMAKWNPLIPITFEQDHVEDTVRDFAKVVDAIEDKHFAPPSHDQLREHFPGTTSAFGNKVCRNCDARFSCSSFREYTVGKGKGAQGSFAKYFNDYGSDTEQEEWVNANLNARTPENFL